MTNLSTEDVDNLSKEIEKIVKSEEDMVVAFIGHYGPDEPMTYAERYRGVEHAYSEDDVCPTCKGDGIKNCPRCGGQGEVKGRNDEYVICPNPNCANGFVNCSTCNGTGKKKEEEYEEHHGKPFEHVGGDPRAPLKNLKEEIDAAQSEIEALEKDVEPEVGSFGMDGEDFEPSYRSQPVDVSNVGPTPEVDLGVVDSGFSGMTAKEAAFKFARAVVDALNRRKFTKPYFFQNASPEDFEVYVRDTILEALYTLPEGEEMPHVEDYIIEYDMSRTMLGFQFETSLGNIMMVLKAPGQGDTWQIVDFEFTKPGSKPKEPEPTPEFSESELKEKKSK